MNRISAALLAAAISLALPASAPAAELFAGVLEDGRLTTFTVPYPWALTTPVTPRGLAAGERLVALGVGPQGPVAVGSSARLYSVDARTGNVAPIGPTFPQGLRGSRFSLAAAPNAATGRLLSDVGQDLIVDLTTGATSDGPGLTHADTGARIQPAADLATDGRLVGSRLSPITVLTETAAGASRFTARELQPTPRSLPRLAEPIGVQLGSDGVGYLMAVAADFERQRQMAMLRFDPATGRSLDPTDRFKGMMSRRFTTFASLGAVPRDTTPPRVRMRLGRSVSVRALLEDRLPLSVRCAEACDITLTLQAGGERIGFGYELRDTTTPRTTRWGARWQTPPETGAVELFYGIRPSRLRAALAGRRRIRVVATVSDLKGNSRKVARTARLVR